MSGTYAVVTMDGDREHLDAGYSKADAERFAYELPELLGISAEVRDLLPGLEARFPVGGKVWLSQRVRWRRGQAGTVTVGEPDDYARWPEHGPSPWFLGSGGAVVHVLLGDGYESWWPAHWLETRDDS
jgi:hypothetical protein